MLRILPFLLALALGACGHSLESGAWVATQDSTVVATVDPCHLLASDRSLFAGNLIIAGDDLHFDAQHSLFQPLALVGRFKHHSVGQIDEFLVDGTVLDQPLEVGGATCKDHFGQFEISGVVDDARHFHGTLTEHHDLHGSPFPSCPDQCDVTVGVRAERSGP